jgi:subtilase family serine protease
MLPTSTGRARQSEQKGPVNGPSMRTQFPGLIRVTLSVFSLLLSFTNSGYAQNISVPPRVMQAVNPLEMVVLRGNTHPLARSEYDRGAVSDAMPMGRVLLLLQRSPDQEQALQQLLEQQQSKSSPNYHAWLTPEQFGQQFGVAAVDIQVITQWLASQGFSQINAGPGRMIIEFAGSAGQVRSAFHTEIHRFVMNGEEHTANVADPQIPAALAPVVAGIVSLHDFPKRSHAKVVGEFHSKIGEPGLQPLLTLPTPFGSGNFYGLGPGDFATIYNTRPLLTAGNDGTGQTIAIVGETNLNVQDVQQFRSVFGLPANFDVTNIVLNGADPGITSTDEETEADLDVQWSGAVAPGATIKFVVSASTPASAGVDLSALYIVEHNFAAVMSESYGACESFLGSAGNAFYGTLWQQAAAQGITAIVSSGDGGSAGCDDFNKPQPATQGLAVSGLASTPYNVSVGGTDFDQVNNWAAYWSATNDATGTSAKSYIPEIPWSQNCAQIGLTGCGSSAPQGSVNIVAGAGGPSAIYPKPKWQLGVAGMPNDSHRDQPDVSLFASVGFNGTAYVLCQGDRIGACYFNSGSVSVELVGGTSASAPAFAGIIALVNQKQSSTNSPAPRQGIANNVLYALANKSGASCTSSPAEPANCVFNGVTKGSGFLPTGKPGVGTNSVPCQGGSPNCTTAAAGGNGVLVDPDRTTTEAWTATAGYDMATGLGSVNVNNLANIWGTASSVGTTTTLTLSPTTGIKHGSAENVAVNVTVKANTGTGTPTGDVSLIASFAGPPATTQGLDHFTLTSTGAVTNATTESLPGGTYNVTAHYAGDGTNAPSDSTPVQVTVSQENSQTSIVVPTFDSTGNLLSGNANSVTYGSNYIIRMYVTNSGATPNPSGPPAPLCAQVNQLTCPTGTVDLTGNGAAVDAGTFPLNSAGYTRDLAPTLAGGSYSLIAKYSGDNSYNASSSTESFTVNPAVTSINGQIFPPVVVGQPSFISFTGYTQALRGVSPTGTVTFFDGSSQLGSPIAVSGGCGAACQPAFFANGSVTMPTAGQRTLVAKYSGDANFAPATASVAVNVLNPTTAAVNVSPANVNYGQAVTITGTIDTSVAATNAALKPTGVVSLTGTYDGAIGSASITTAAGAGGNWEIQVAATITPQFNQSFMISYAGDSNYSGISASSELVTVIIPDFTLSPVNGLNLQPVAGQASSGQVTIAPATSTASSVSLSLVAPVISGYTITLNPQQVSLNGAPATATISFSPVSSTSASMILNNMHHASLLNFQASKYWTISLVSGLASCVLFLSPWGRKRKRAVCSPGLVCLLTFALGCGGGSSASPSSGGSGAGGGGGTPPAPTSITLSTSNPKVTQNQPFLITATVTSTKPLTGNVTFYNFGSPIAGFPISNGQAQVGGPGYINNPGLYQITATYGGDVNNQSSTSSALTQVITGTMPGTLVGKTGGDIHSIQVNFGVQ